MKLTRLRYLVAVTQDDLNITIAAAKLNTSQPGVSKQLKLLEAGLGFPPFERDGRSLTRVTPAGQNAMNRALRVLEEAQYVLPPVITTLRQRYPKVDPHLHQGTSEQRADLVIATG